MLGRLKILKDGHKGPSKIPSWSLLPEFAQSLRTALLGGGKHQSFGVAAISDSGSSITVDFLDSFARKQWEAILYFVVGSVNPEFTAQEEITAGTRDILVQGGFVKLKATKRAQITQKGFEFLLEEINGQVWTLLLEYLKLTGKLQMDEVEALSFLFTLGSLDIGTCYEASDLTDTQAKMLDDLSDLGIIYRADPDSTHYYPTRLATTLTSDSSALPNSAITSTTVTTTTGGQAAGASESEKGFIILETNYRLYAYTSSPLLIAILNLFATLKTRYPNMVTATLTKTSIQHAISLGITADQIVSYLTTHAHPILKRSIPILPPTVVDQVRLWQLEGERMKATPGFLIRDVGTLEDFEKAVTHAETLGVLVWRDDAKRWFFVNKFEQMQLYFRNESNRRKELAAKT